MYGLAMPFARNDDHLSIVDIHNQLPREAVWSLVYEGAQEGIRRPQVCLASGPFLPTWDELGPPIAFDCVGCLQVVMAG